MYLNVRVAYSNGTVLGMQFQWGLEISGLVGHVYPCVCVWGGGVERERQT